MQEKVCTVQTNIALDARPFSVRAAEIRGDATVRSIAQGCDLSESMVSRYLSGTNMPPDDIANRIMQYLHDVQTPVQTFEPVMQTMQTSVQTEFARPDEKISADDAPDTITLPVWAYQAQMADYQKTIAELRADHEKQVAELRADYGKTVRRMQRLHYVMLGIVVALLAVIIYLVVDATHGGWGFFRSSADLILTGAL